MRKTFFAIFVVIILFASGFWLFTYDNATKQAHDNEPISKESKCPYKNINPLRCEPDMVVQKKEYVLLRNDLNEYIERKKSENVLSNAAVYFRDLQNGPIMSINSQEKFTPASLLKLPVMISYYKKAEKNPDILQTRVQVPEDINVLTQGIESGVSIKPGDIYSVDELIKIMITKSDNVAASVLILYLQQNFPQDNYISTLDDLGIIDPKSDITKQFITTLNYASIFRSLYNVSYLNLEMSNKALDLLLYTEFNDGLVAGVPSNIRVAHKFGERKDGNDQQLHDCGIIYYPNNPYLLCIMIKGNNVDDLKTVIKDISKKVYDEVVYRDTN